MPVRRQANPGPGSMVLATRPDLPGGPADGVAVPASLVQVPGITHIINQAHIAWAEQRSGFTDFGTRFFGSLRSSACPAVRPSPFGQTRQHGSRGGPIDKVSDGHDQGTTPPFRPDCTPKSQVDFGRL